MRNAHNPRWAVLAFALATALGSSSALAASATHALPKGKAPRTASGNNAETFDRFIVTYKAGTTPQRDRSIGLANVRSAIARSGMSTAGANAVSAQYVRRLGTGADLMRTSRKLDAASANVLLQQIAADPNVASVQIDRRMYPVRDLRMAVADVDAPVAVDDPHYATYQWHLREGAGASETVGADSAPVANRGGSNVAKAWNYADGTGVVVAVLDTGITQHPDLDLSLADAGYDFISDAYTSGRASDGRAPGGWDLGDWTDAEPYLSNYNCVNPNNPARESSWHGTHVSGTVGEITNNAAGMAGAAYGAKVLPVRVLGHCGGYTSDIADGIIWAAGGHVEGVPDNQLPAQVINMSLGGSGVCTADDITGQAIAQANSLGAVVIVAAGNANYDAGSFSPASCPGVITVAANGVTGKRAYYSNYGSKITLSAPGGGVFLNDDPNAGVDAYAGYVWSAINGGAHEPGEPMYGGMAGTSQATPHVSAVAALMIAAARDASQPALTPTRIRQILTATARPFPATPDKAIGPGIVDAYAAVNLAMGKTDVPLVATPLSNGVTVRGLSGSAGQALLFRIDVPAGARNLTLRTLGGTGDVTLSAGLFQPTFDTPLPKVSEHIGNTESYIVAAPQAGTYYVQVSGVSTFTNVSLLAVYSGP
ncbi:MAG TPA: S8 family serine peptidase [Stenotrophomonas sp.]|nr:S8 family serine peptidase [Stenotrophomonas sp.]